jgi:hypothetical protein
MRWGLWPDQADPDVVRTDSQERLLPIPATGSPRPVAAVLTCLERLHEEQRLPCTVHHLHDVSRAPITDGDGPSHEISG